ncbi:MAG TPA: LysR family transcriptional regulator [Rhizobacter sp.]|nr:LysR family transcriptional regulator [Rhizobacter sp.]
MNNFRRRPLSVGPIRAFEAVSRHLSFRAAAEELSLTQSAVSRQIQALEEDLGATLLLRGTRKVELTPEGAQFLRVLAPSLSRIDASVQQIRQSRGRRVVSVNTFASFASMWLIPPMEAFQREHPEIDIRVQATDVLANPDDPEFDLILRYSGRHKAPPDAQRLFGEVITPVISPWLAEQIRQGASPPLSRPEHIAQYTVTEEDDPRPSAEYLSWRYWLAQMGAHGVQPRRWLYLNFTYQQVQAALAGQGLALARLPLVAEQLERGDLIEPFGPGGRIVTPQAYWLITVGASRQRQEVEEFCRWVEQRAAQTRKALGEA